MAFSFDDLEEFQRQQKYSVDRKTSKYSTATEKALAQFGKMEAAQMEAEEAMPEPVAEPLKKGPGRPKKVVDAPAFDVATFAETMGQVFQEGAKAQTAAINAANAQLFKDFPFMVEAGIAKEKGELLRKIAEAGENLAVIEKRLAEAEKSRTVEVNSEFGKIKVEGFVHYQFDSLLHALGTQFPIMLVGGAGTGKTYAAEQCAKALGLDFYAMSVGSQTSQSNLIGFMNANGNYVSTQFRTAYEHGGVFVLDEIDAGNPNVLIVLNSALASGFCPFPDKDDEMIEKHPNFKLIATANTYGTGASRKYVGRNQLDAATLDRFITLEWKVDEGLERQLVSHLPDGLRWQAVIKAVRDKVIQHSYEVIVSPRATLKGAQLLAVGYDFRAALDAALLASIPPNHADVLRKAAHDAW